LEGEGRCWGSAGGHFGVMRIQKYGCKLEDEATTPIKKIGGGEERMQGAFGDGSSGSQGGGGRMAQKEILGSGKRPNCEQRIMRRGKSRRDKRLA